MNQLITLPLIRVIAFAQGPRPRASLCPDRRRDCGMPAVRPRHATEPQEAAIGTSPGGSPCIDSLLSATLERHRRIRAA